MKQYRKQIIFLFGAIAMFAYFSFQYMPTQPQDSITVMEETKEDQIQVYVLDQDNTLIPMSKTIKTGLSTEDKIKELIKLMCADQAKDSFSGVLGQGTSAKEVIIEDAIASIYFDDGFATYDAKQELRVLEALTWGITQFKEVKEVKLYVNDALLQEMPLAKTPIPTPLDRSLGINHFESATSSLNHSDTITVYYTKKIDNSAYFVPKSKRIAGDSSDMETVVKEVLKDVSVSSKLESPLYEDNIDAMDLPRREDDILIVNMSNSLLSSDRSAKQEAYEALVLSLAVNFGVDEVKVFVDDHVVSLHGSNEEALSVSSLIYNPIPF